MTNAKRYAIIAQKYLGYVNYFLLAMAVIAIAVLFFAIVYQVLMRYFLDRPTGWVFEVAGYCLVFIIFLPMARVEQLGQQIKVDAITMRLSNRTNLKLNIAGLILGLVYVGFFALSAIEETRLFYDRGDNSGIYKMGIDLWPFRAVLATGMVCLWLNLLVSLIKSINEVFHNHGNNVSSGEQLKDET